MMSRTPWIYYPYSQRAPLHPSYFTVRPTPAIVRAALTAEARIRSLMADDMRERAAVQGSVVHEDLVLVGWTARQIAEHATAAALLAQRRRNQSEAMPTNQPNFAIVFLFVSSR